MLHLYFCETRDLSYWFSSVFCLFVHSQRAKLNLPALQAEARLQTDSRGNPKAIAMTIAAFFFSYVPAILYPVVSNKEKSQADTWFAFFAWQAVSFSSAVNPMIYYLRTSRQHSANSSKISSGQATSKTSQVVGYKEQRNGTIKGLPLLKKRAGKN